MIETIATVAGLLGISAVELAKHINQKSTEKRNQKIDEEIANRLFLMDQISQNGLMTKALCRYYTDDKLKRGNLYRYAYSTDGNIMEGAMAYRQDWVELTIALGQNENEYTLQLPVKYEFPKRYKDKVGDLMIKLEQLKIKIWDAPIYRLGDVNFETNKLQATFSIDNFYRFRFTIGLLQDEILDALIDADLNVEKIDFLFDMPMRNEMLPKGNNFLDFNERVCAGGISTVFAIARPQPDNDFVIPVQKRSSSVSDSRGLLSPIPRAFHQPMVNAKSELKLPSTVYRELYEELFGGVEAEEDVRRLKPDWWLNDSEVIQWLFKHKGAYTFECICFGLDLLSGNYHFGILLVIKDEAFWNKFGSQLITNWEVAEGGGELISTKDYNLVKEYTRRVDWTEDIFVFIESLKRLVLTEPRRMNIPTLERVVSE